MKTQQAKAVWTEIKSFLRYLIIAAAVILFLITFAVQRADVYGASMEPTLKDGDIMPVSYTHLT